MATTPMMKGMEEEPPLSASSSSSSSTVVSADSQGRRKRSATADGKQPAPAAPIGMAIVPAPPGKVRRPAGQEASDWQGG